MTASLFAPASHTRTAQPALDWHGHQPIVCSVSTHSLVGTNLRPASSMPDSCPSLGPTGFAGASAPALSSVWV